MTVRELITMLELFDDNMKVVMSSDAEGNKIGPIAEVCANDWYVPESPWSGDLLAEEDIEEYGDGGFRVVSIWPVN